MNIDELTKRLEALKATVPASTIRRWANDGLITPPNKRHRRTGEGRGTISDWSERSLQEATGCYCAKHYGSYRRDFSDSIMRAKHVAGLLYADPLGFMSSYWPNIYRDYYVRYDYDESQQAVGFFLYESDRRDFFEYVGGIEKAKLGSDANRCVYCNFLFAFSGDIDSGGLQYTFAGVALTPREIGELTEVRVITAAEPELLEWVERHKKQVAAYPHLRSSGDASDG